MPRGKRSSEAAKELAGTLENSRRVQMVASDLPSKPNGAPSFPEPPATLNEYGCKVYWELVAHLHYVDALFTIDILIVSNAAYWAQVHHEYQQLAIDKGLIQTFENGTRQISPELSVLNAAEKHMQNYYDLLGIGQKGREGIAAFSGAKKNGGEDAFTLLQARLNTDPA